MEQTIIEWFNQLQEPHKSQAITNLREDRRLRFVDCMSEAIDKGFTWDETPQGHSYWQDLRRLFLGIEATEKDKEYLKQMQAIDDMEKKIEKEKVIFSTSMRDMLDKIADDSMVASYMRREKYTINTFCNYVTTRNGMLSYLPNGREHKTNPDNGKWLRDGRQEMKPSKLARKILREDVVKELNDTDFEKFANKVRAYLGVVGDEDGLGKNINIEIVQGKDIRPAYYHLNYSRVLGESTNLHGSCMRSGEAQSYFGIYEDNPDKVQLLVARDEEGKVLGRALLWNFDDGDKGMDTIYGPDVIAQLFKDWAVDNGYWYKSNQSCHHHQFDKFKGEGVDLKSIGKWYRRVTITNHEFDYYPYVDSLYHLSLDRDGKWYLSNEYKTEDIEKTLRHTGGMYEEYDDDNDDDGYVTLENGDRCHEDDATWLDYRAYNGDRVQGYYHEEDVCYTECGSYMLTDHCTRIGRDWYSLDDDAIAYIEDRDAWFLADDTVYCEVREVTIHIDDAVELADSRWCDKDEAFQCAYDDEWYEKSEMVTAPDGAKVCESNLESYLEQIKQNENEEERETTVA